MQFNWDHLQLCSPDPEATAAWFGRCLNAELVRRPGRVDFRLGSVQFFITRVAPDTPATRGRNEAGIDHFGVTVQDLDRAFAHLQECAAEIVEPIFRVRAGVRACFVRAPGNILVEILERKPEEMEFN